MSIHPTAWIEPGAEIGDGVDIGPFCAIHAETRIGAGSRLGPHVTVLPHTQIGPRCQIHAGAVLGDLPQDLAFKPVRSRVVIGADCVLREHVTLHRGTREDTETVVGDGCYIMAGAHVAHNCRLGSRVILANGVLLGGYVEVGDRAFLSGNVVVHQFAHIGRLVMAGGGCGISKDVPPFCLVVPIRLNRIAGLNIIGLRRAEFTPEQRKSVRQAFDLLYRSGLNTTEAVKRLRAEFPDGPASEFAAFIADAKRGICRFAGRGDAADDE